MLPFKFNIFSFIIGFSLGLLYVYLAAPTKKIIIRYPTPHNAGKIIYKDVHDKHTCYMYKSEIIECPADSKNIKEQSV